VKFQYESFEPQSRDDLQKAFLGDDSARIRDALYSAAQYEPDWRWTQEQCLKFLHHSDYLVRWAAALSLGYIALYHKHLDLVRVLPELHRASADAEMRGPVQDSLEMIDQNIPKN
jgi:HEAT repeat protein